MQLLLHGSDTAVPSTTDVIYYKYYGIYLYELPQNLSFQCQGKSQIPEGCIDPMALLQRYQSEILNLRGCNEQRRNHGSMKRISMFNIFSMFPLGTYLDFSISSVSWLEPWLSPICINYRACSQKQLPPPQIFCPQISYQPLSQITEMRLFAGSGFPDSFK